MPNHRTPLDKAKATGRTMRDPARFAGRREPKNRPLGAPTAHMTDDQKRCWEAFKTELPWLTEGDRTIVESASILRAKLWGGSACIRTINSLRQHLGELGATPAARTKIHVADEPESDPSDEFLN